MNSSPQAKGEQKLNFSVVENNPLQDNDDLTPSFNNPTKEKSQSFKNKRSTQKLMDHKTNQNVIEAFGSILPPSKRAKSDIPLPVKKNTSNPSLNINGNNMN